MQVPHLIIENTGTWSSPAEPTFSRPRFVLRYELEYYLGDEGETWIDGEHFELRRGTVLFCRPGQLRFSRLPFSARFLYFDVENTPQFTGWLASLPCCIHAPTNVGDSMTVMERLFHENGYTAQLEMQTRLFSCLLCLSRSEGQHVTQTTHAKQEEVFRAIQYMKEHLYEACGVSDFAAKTGYSVPHFNAFFRGQAAIHFMQFIQRMSRTLRTLDIVTFIGQILSQRRQEIQLSGSL